MSVQTLAFAALCRGARGFLGWSQSDLARACQMALPSIARIETGAVNPRHDSVMKIMKIFQEAGLVIEHYSFDGDFTIRAPRALFEQATLQVKTELKSARTKK